MRVLTVCAVVLLLGACAAPTERRPGWVDTPPDDDRHLYGIGSAGQVSGSNPDRPRQIAHARALESLGKAVRVRVQSTTTIIDRDSWTDYEVESIQFSDEELEGVEIVDVWEQPGGVRGRPLRTWVLVRLPIERALSATGRAR